jgi:hypothetical protein
VIRFTGNSDNWHSTVHDKATRIIGEAVRVEVISEVLWAMEMSILECDAVLFDSYVPKHSSSEADRQKLCRESTTQITVPLSTAGNLTVSDLGAKINLRL